MYCDKKTKNDCKNKAFYRTIDEEDIETLEKLNLMIESTVINSSMTQCNNNNKVEDKVFCNTYHMCREGRDEHYICENQLLFNPLSQMCDYPINVPCFNKKIYKKDMYMYAQSKNEQKSYNNNAKPMNLMQNLINNQNYTMKNITQVNIYGVKIDLKCPVGAKNYLMPDKTYCNIFHHCHGNSGNVFMCEKGQAFDPTANGPEKSGVCNFEDLVNCAGKYILTENGQRTGEGPKTNFRSAIQPGISDKNTEKSIKQSNFASNMIGSSIQNSKEELVSGIPFDCRGKANGHWRDFRYCDVFHACIGEEQKKTYSCAQLGERIYFDEISKRCEFVKNNPTACMANSYFQQIVQPPSIINQVVSDEPNEAWKQFIRSKEQFSCKSRLDGFYASRWCNVFYRCFIGVKTEFLCPKMLNADRLWWVAHGSSQETPQTSATCVWPCDTNKQCISPGGHIIENGDGSYSESVHEADRVWRSSNCGSERSIGDIFKIPDQDFSCIGLQEGNFYPSKYCNVFHRCTSGKRKDFQCPKATNSPYDLWWNEAINQCDWPCKVTCFKPVFGSQKSATDIQNEDRALNEEECRKAKAMPFMTSTQPVISAKPISEPFPDENFICPGIGLFLSAKYCNVYYDCKVFGQSPFSAYYCVEGNFDNISKMCTNQIQCSYNPPLMYPLISIVESNPPEDVGCSNTIGYYIIHSNRYCNIYYTCDGRSSKPQAFRCYDRQNLEDAIYNRESKKCESKRGNSCQGEILSIKLRYQSSPVDHTRLPDLQPLSCRADQQYLAEHDKFCNLYHSCILGKYQMYTCVTIGSYDKTSYFYYTNGDCAAPNAAQCGPNKSVYSYEKLFPNDINTLIHSAQNQERYMPIISPSIANKGQSTFGSVSLKINPPYSPECQLKHNYLIPHQKFCNIFYECSNGKLTAFACVDSLSGLFSGIFDENIKGCKPFNSIDCPSNSIFNPDESKSLDLNLSNQFYEGYNENKFFEDASFKTESNFSCVGKQNGYYESEWCNVFFRCISGKRIDTKCSSGIKSYDSFDYDLWWEHQNSTYNPLNPLVFIGSDEDAKCEWPCKVKCNKLIWTEKGKEDLAFKIQERDNELHPECTVLPENDNRVKKTYQAYETENINPSGFFCENDGIFKDQLYCNIFHVCKNKDRKTYQCKHSENEYIFSIFDSDKNDCVSKNEGFSKCNGIIYDSNFLSLPAYRDLPSIKQSCLRTGIFRAYDKNTKFCDLFYWCENENSEPLYLYCDVAIYGKGSAYFNFDAKKCDLSQRVDCPPPNKIYLNILQNKDQLIERMKESKSENENNLKNLIQTSPYMMQIISGLLDPAPGYLSLPSSQFQTNFKCPLNSPGYYPNSEYCDIFHYCYTNGQYKTYVCASMQNKYQLWWSHQQESPRRDNIFCDWPCNLVGPNTVCPSNKRVLMRDRQQVSGGISQQEVLASTCTNNGGVSTTPYSNSWQNSWTSTIQSQIILKNNPINMPNNNHHETNIGGYSPCTSSIEWFNSPSIIKCNLESRLHGFAPDPRDCSKYYRCDQNIENDGTSNGYLMSCVAGLWWNQEKRMCLLPSEVACNPYKIINDKGKVMETNIGTTLCRGLGLTCNQVGLSDKYLMKNIKGKPNSYFKCDGFCAVEMNCPLGLVFDYVTQRCEWPQSQNKMAALKASEDLSKTKNIKSNSINEIPKAKSNLNESKI